MKKQSAIQWILLLSVCAMCMWPAVPALAEQRAEAEVQLRKAEGTVEVTDPAGRVQQRFANMKLDQGNRICTEEDGTAWIGAESGEQLRLDAGSRMELRTAGGTPEYLLDAGNLYFYMEGQEEDGIRIRTAAAAMHAQGAVGWVKVTDRYHTVICLLEGTLQCAVTDPVTGQMKQAAVTGGSLAECVIDPNASRDSRCDILLRDLTAEDLDGFVLAELTEDTALAERLSDLSGLTLPEDPETAGKRLTASREKLAAHMEKMLQESQGYAALRDPVWTGDRDYASVPGEADESAQGKDAGQGTSTSSGTDNPSSGSSGRQPDAQTVPVVTVPVSSASSAPETPSPKKKKGSGSSAPAEPEKPAVPSTPATPSTPAAPTENQGLVIEGIAHNGPQGVIEVQEGGRIHVEGSDVFRNEGKLTSSGVIDSKVSNEGGEFLLSGGSVAGVEQKGGTASITGGTVTGSSSLTGGTLQITGGRLAGLTQSEGSLAVSGGTITDVCSIGGGEFHLSGGTVASVRQSQGDAEISGGNVTGDCVVEGGSLQITDGRLAKVTQKEGTLTVSGGTVAGECSVTGGDFRLSGGTVASIRQSQGNAEISGGTITGNCSVEGGAFRLADGQLPGLSQNAGTVRISGGSVTGSCALEGGNFYLSEGTVDKIAQKAGTVSLSGGSIMNGCTIEGGRLELSGGTVQAGSAKAALAVQSGTAARSKDTAVTAENANAYITGGTLIGNGQGKSAIYAEAGTIMVADAAKTWIKATEAFRTITGSRSSGWAVRYVEAGGGDYVMGADSFDNPDGSSVIYVTKKESDGLMRLRRLSDDFLDVSRAGAGDVLTLCGDVTYQTAPSVLAVTGGTAEEPVTLDLNGRTLNLMDQDMQGGTSVEIREDAVWEISGGQICAKSICGKESGTAILSGTEIRTSVPLLAEGSSILTIRDCKIPVGVGAGGSGTLQVSASELGGIVQGAQNGTITISGTQADLQQIQNTGSAAITISGTQVDLQQIQNSGSAVITLSDASKLTISQGVYNTGMIQVDGAELLSSGGEIANKGIMNLTGGTIAHIRQKDGIFHMDGGTVTDGCTVTGGRFEMADGTLQAGSAEAALKAECIGTMEDAARLVSVLEENANVWIRGGTVLGAGEKKAFDIREGRVWIAEDTIIKAGAAVNTIACDTAAGAKNWGVQYANYLMQPNWPPVIYVTKKDTDGMMRLCRLDDDFGRVAQAEDGDVITLSGDVTHNDVVEATGGSKDAPVTLNLNDYTISLHNPAYNNYDALCFSSAVWEIQGGDAEQKGKISLTFDRGTSAPGSGRLFIYNDSNISIQNTIVDGVLMNDASVLDLLNSKTTALVYNQNYGVFNIECSEIENLDNTGHSTMTISNGSTVKYRSRSSLINNADFSILTISDSVVDICNRLSNTDGSTLNIVRTVVQTRLYGGSYKQCEIFNDASSTFSLTEGSSLGGDDPPKLRNMGTMVLSDSEIKGGIDNGGDCTLTNCQMTVTKDGIYTDYGRLYINGGRYEPDPEARTLKEMILFSAHGEHILEIGRNAVLDTRGTDVIPLVLHRDSDYLPTYNFEVTLGEVTIMGGDSVPAIQGIVIEDTQHPEQVHTQRISINDGASISSEYSEGTVILENRGDCSKLQLNLRGGEIINEGKGPALCMSDFNNISNMTATKIKSKSENPLAAWTNKKLDLDKELPPEYAVVEEGEYHILLRYDPQAEESAVQAIQEDEMDEEDAKMNESGGQTDEESVISKDQGQPSEEERKPDDTPPAAEDDGESKPSSQPDGREGKEDGTEQSAGTEDGKEDTEQSAGTEDGSVSGDPSASKENGPKDAASPSDQTEEPGDGLPSSGQTEDSLLPDPSGRPDPASQSSDEDEEPDSGSSSGKSGKAAHPEDAALPSDSSGRSRAGDSSEEADTGE